MDVDDASRDNIISSGFIWNFKLGDNLIYNINILCLLYIYLNKEQEEKKYLLYKPIIIIIISLIEALLYDFHQRIKEHKVEGILNIPTKIIDYIRGSKGDLLYHYIESAKMHDLFDSRNTKLYDVLHQLRELRNRIHIQNGKRTEPLNEEHAFTEKKCFKLKQFLKK